MSKKDHTWINAVLDMTKELESPENYFLWSALSVLSASVQKRIYWDRYADKIYPNIFVFLIGDSGIRKGLPVKFAKTCIEKLKTVRHLAGRYSIQGLLKELSTARTVEGGMIYKDAQCFLVSGEFAASLIRDEYSVGILTDLYNASEHETWTNTLKTEERETLKNPCITLLGASNEVNLASFLTSEVKGGGFLARTFCIYSNERRAMNSLMYEPTDTINYDILLPHLRVINKLEGPVQPTKAARTLYDEWYQDFTMRGEKDETGTLRRMHDQVLKVAMLLSLSEREDLIITIEHIEDALKYCEKTLPAVKRLVMGVGKSEQADPTAKILKRLLEMPTYEMNRESLLRWGWGDFDASVLDKIIDTLDQAGAIKYRREGKHIIYRLKDETVKAYQEAKKEIQ